MKSMSDIRTKRTGEQVYRGSQVIYGERQKLQEVLRSVGRFGRRSKRKQQEIRQLKQLIQARTVELNGINRGWDRKLSRARNPKTGMRELLRLAANIPPADYLLARTVAEHPAASAALLESLAIHPYSAVRQNVARHPNTPAAVLERLARDSHEPLWFLVACNPSAPSELRARLKAKMRQDPSPAE